MGDDSEERLKGLAALIERPGHESARASFNSMCRSIVGEGGHMRFSAPSPRLNHLVDEQGRSQLAEGGYNPLELFCLAAMHVVKQRGEGAFGSVRDMDQAKKKLESLRLERQAAIDALEHSWDASDLVLQDSGPPRFKRFPNVELVSRDLGQRLLDSTLRESQAVKPRAA